MSISRSTSAIRCGSTFGIMPGSRIGKRRGMTGVIARNSGSRSAAGARPSRRIKPPMPSGIASSNCGVSAAIAPVMPSTLISRMNFSNIAHW
jgi:hypothetical protein